MGEIVYWDDGSSAEIVAVVYIHLLESGRLQVPRDRWQAFVAAMPGWTFRRRYD